MTNLPNLLDTAELCGYKVLPVTEAASRDGRILMLRHDVDISLESSLELAVYEYGRDIRATYFVQVTSPFYGVASERGISSLDRLRAMGHEVGLHYDAGSRVSLTAQAALFSEVIGGSAWPISLHSPTVACPVGSISHMSQVTAGINVNGPDVQLAFRYVTDSLLVWRQDPLKVFDTGDKVQLLLHPEHYAYGAPFGSFRTAYRNAIRVTDGGRDLDLLEFFHGADISIANRARLDPLILKRMLSGS